MPLYAKWTAHANRATDATYTVNHAAGSSSISVNQQAGGGVWNLLGTFDLNGASTFVLTDKADGIVVADAVRLVQVSAPAPAATGIFYVHADHLGTPKTVTDAAQGIAWAADYLPYGEAQVTVETVTLNVRFPGQYHDAETALHYNYFRFYGPGSGRYIQSDPIGIDGGLNTYLYANANPNKFIDPYGLDVYPAPGDEPPGKCWRCDEVRLDRCLDYAQACSESMKQRCAAGEQEACWACQTDIIVIALCYLRFCSLEDCDDANEYCPQE